MIVLLIIGGCQKDQTDGSLFPEQEVVNAYMEPLMALSDLPGVVAMAASQAGEEISFTFGRAIWDEEGSVSPNHIYQLHSMTKLITSVAALQLVERGQLGLDEDLSALMPEMAQIPILENGELRKGENPITLRHLLTHTSGFGYACCTDEELAEYDYEEWTFSDAPRRFESGTQFLYGTSLGWVGKVIEKVSNSSLETYFLENITGPLKMDRTFFNVPDSLYSFIVSRGYRGTDGKQALSQMQNRTPKEEVTTFSGDDGLWSTPSDYLKLLRCLLDYGTLGEVQILKSETVSEMMQNQIGDINMDSSGNYFNPAYCCNLEGFTSDKTKWGLAWAIDNQGREYGRKPGTVFWGGMMNTYFYIDYSSGITACIFTQHLPFNHPATTSLFDAFSKVIYRGNDKG